MNVSLGLPRFEAEEWNFDVRSTEREKGRLSNTKTAGEREDIIHP